MSMAPEAALVVLTDLVRTGVIEGSATTGFRVTADEQHAAEAALLIDANERFPVQLIRSIYEPAPSPAKSFADAFVLRKGAP